MKKQNVGVSSRKWRGQQQIILTSVAQIMSPVKIKYKINKQIRFCAAFHQNLYLSESGSWGPWDLVEGIDWYADHGGQSHGEADGQGPAGVHVVVICDGLVLDHREDQNELQEHTKTVAAAQWHKETWFHLSSIQLYCAKPALIKE